MTNTRRCTEQLEVKLSEMDKVRAGARLADLCAKKDAAVAAKQSAMSHHAAHIKEIDEAIQQATGVVIRGYERRLVECEWRFHDPREDYKTLYRVDLGEPVTVEEMTFADKQGSLFPEAEAQPEQAWPVAINGVYPDDQAEVLAHEFGDGSSAKLRVLQVGEDRWTSSYDFATSGREAAFAGELEYGYDDKSREASIRSAAEVAIYEIRAIAANMKSDGVRAQLEAIQEWFRGQGGYIALAEQSGGSAWPKPDEDDIYPEELAEEVRPEKLPRGASALIRVLQIGPEEWIAAEEIGVGELSYKSLLERGAGDEVVMATRGAVIRASAEVLVRNVEEHLRAARPKTERAQLLAIGKWAKNLIADVDQVAEDTGGDEDGNGLAGEFAQLDHAAATAQQAVAAAEQYRAKATGAADWQ